MFRAFDVDGVILKSENLLRKGREITESQAEEVRGKLESFLMPDGSIDGTRVHRNWFPKVEADVFLSHSHQDQNLALTLAGWLSENFGLRPFVDSSVWGNSADLLREIDNRYCPTDDGLHYDYDKRNGSTSHVHMLLATALTMMIDHTECAWVLNTKNSITTKEAVTSRAVAGGERLALTAASSHRPGAARVGPIAGLRFQRDGATGELEMGALPGSAAVGPERVEPAGVERARRVPVSDDRSVVGGEITSAEGASAEGPRVRGTPSRALAAAANHRPRAAIGRLARADQATGEIEVGALPSAEVERASLGAAGVEGLGLAATSRHRCGAARGGPIGVPLSPPDDGTRELELGTLPRSVVAGVELVEPAGSERARPAAVRDGSAVADGEIASAEGGGTEGQLERATPRWRTAPHPAQGPPGGGTEIRAGAEPAEELPDGVLLQRDE